MIEAAERAVADAALAYVAAQETNAPNTSAARLWIALVAACEALRAARAYDPIPALLDARQEHPRAAEWRIHETDADE